MGFGDLLGKAAKGVAKTVGSVALGSIGVVSSAVEFIGASGDSEAIEELGHVLKSASFNCVRKMWGAEPKEFDRSVGDAGRSMAEDMMKQRERSIAETKRRISEENEKIKDAEQRLSEAVRLGRVTPEYAAEQRARINAHKAMVRRTDEELNKDRTDVDRPPRSFEYESGVPLPAAMSQASASPGVYILWLNGTVMKCGRSSQGGGVRKRLLEYYRLDYDKRAKQGDYWSVTEDNRDDVVVSWQCCPISKCHELEYKLFKKYGKGPWAQRAPISCSEDTWELLI